MVVRRVAMVAMVALAQQAAAQSGMNDWYTIPMAAARNDTGLVQQMLVDPQNDPDAIESSGGRTALDYAASFNNPAMASMLLSHNAHVDARDKTGNTALDYAAEFGHLDILRLLLDAKADPNAANREGVTPLMFAADKSQPTAIRALLTRGADPKKQDFTGRDAYGWAADKPTSLQALNQAKR
jgi:uncharacterized protein